MQSRRGFSVVEVLLVTAILLIITAFTVPKVYLEIENSKELAALSTLHSIESVFRITRTMLLVEPENAPTTGYQNNVFERHIPARYAETAWADGDYYEAQIAYAFAQKPPCYEITQTFAKNETTMVIRYWPEPVKEPKRCYTLQNGAVQRTDGLRPKQKEG